MRLPATILVLTAALVACGEQKPAARDNEAAAPAAAPAEAPATAEGSAPAEGLDAASAGDPRRADPATAPEDAHSHGPEGHDHGPGSDHKH